MSQETITSSNRSHVEYWKELWRYRELMLLFTWRDILVRYKQTVIIGVLWALAEPLAAPGVMQPVVDFSGYNQFTKEAVPQSGLARCYFESRHFTVELGDLVLRRPLEKQQPAAAPGPGAVWLRPHPLQPSCP